MSTEKTIEQKSKEWIEQNCLSERFTDNYGCLIEPSASYSYQAGHSEGERMGILKAIQWLEIIEIENGTNHKWAKELKRQMDEILKG